MRFDFVSPKFCQIYDIAEEDFIRDPSLAFSVTHPEDSESLIKTNQHATENAESFHWEGRYLVNEEIVWVEISSEPSLLPNGDTLFSGIIRDITERKKVEEALIESERRLTDAQRVGKIGSFTLDLTTGLWSGTEMLYPILGIEGKIEYSIEEWVEIIHPDSRDNLAAYHKNLLEQKLPFDT